MKTRVLFLLAAMGLLASCSKEMVDVSDEPVSDASVTTYVTVGISVDTKTVMDEGKDAQNHHKQYWSNGDKININGTSSAALSDVAAKAQMATFSFTGSLSTPYKVLYPADIYVDATHVDLPATQTYRAGGFADGMFPMAGYATSESAVTLSPLCALLKVSVLRASANADEDDIVSVSFKGRSDEQVKGSFTIDYSNHTLTGASSAAEDKEVKINKSQTTSTSEPVVYYLVVPAGTYSNGFDVKIQDRNGHYMVKSKTTSATLTAGHLYNLPNFEFVPTATEIGIEINSAAKLIQFATDYNNKAYDDAGSGLVANITADLAFDATTSAAFNATGGIGLKIGVNGSEDYYFNGLINGNEHTISGLTATVPLVVATGSSGSVKDLTIASSCSFTFTAPADADAYYGPVVGYHKGFMTNVIVDANVAIAPVNDGSSDEGAIEHNVGIGGLAGRVTVGSIDECAYSGAISVPAGFVVSGKKFYIGGLTGCITNTDGIVMNSDFKGTIENEGRIVGTSNNTDPTMFIAGIAGSNAGTVSACTTFNHETGITVTLNDGSDHNYNGTVVSHTVSAHHYALAGIVGDNSGKVTACTNNANLLNIFSVARASSDANGRYLECAGIVGINREDASVRNSNNYGAIIDRANPKMHYDGGVVGRNFGTVASCDNKKDGAIAVGTSHTKPYGVRQLRLGGVIGRNESGAVVTNVHNEANLNVSRLEGTTAAFSYIGGIIGDNAEEIDGSVGGSITNSGKVAQTSGIAKVTAPWNDNGNGDQGLFVGGIVGYSTKTVKNVTNSGVVSYTCTAAGIGAQFVYVGGIVGKVYSSDATVDVDNCANSANVSFVASATNKDNSATVYNDIYLGGVVGHATNAAIKGGCTNGGVVKGGDGSQKKNTTNTFWVGGIVGYITGASSITACTHTGTSYNDHFSNSGVYDCPMNGGIAGFVAGEDGAPISVSNCEIASTAAITSRRGTCGGIVGGAQYASISDCTVPLSFTGASAYFYGGIVALAQNTTVSGCTYSGTAIQSSQIQAGGGIVGKLDTGSAISGCSSHVSVVDMDGTAIETAGAIAGSSVEGTTINNCHYVNGDLAICSDANFTGSGNVADL